MTDPAPRTELAYSERSDAMAEFLRAAGPAPRLLPAEETVGCPLFNALAALQWTSETGLLQGSDRLHAVWFHGEAAAVVIERVIEEKVRFRYLGPQMETRQPTAQEGTVYLDEPFVRGYDFDERWSAIAHFLQATQGKGALLSLFSTRGPEVEHVRRWLTELFHGPLPAGTDHLQALWASTLGAGFVFPPASYADGRERGWVYLELGSAREG